MARRRVGFSLPVTVVVLAIAFIYFSTVFVFIDRWLGLTSSPGIANAAVFSIVALMCIYTYAVSIFIDPGRVPANYMPDVEDPESTVHEIKRKGGDLRYCQKCSCFKPPRAHHCRVCKRCVLRMDHHCIWINNCVGHANYKVFFVFVVYAVTSCIYSLVLLVGSLTIVLREDEEEMGNYLRTIYIISALLLFPLSIALSVLLGWHVYLILQNKTTIEYHEGVRAMWLAEKGGDVYKHPYDIGAYENLTLVTTIFPLFPCLNFLSPIVSGFLSGQLKIEAALVIMYWIQTSSVGYVPRRDILVQVCDSIQHMISHRVHQLQNDIYLTSFLTELAKRG